MELKDSGARSEFETGAVRDLQEGKGRMDLLPLRALREVSKIFEAGAKKYDADNWRKGIPIERFVDSGKRHLDKWIMGQDDEPHLAQACWNMLCLLETVLMIQDGKLPESLGQGLYERKVVADSTLKARNRINEMMEACQAMARREKLCSKLDPPTGTVEDDGLLHVRVVNDGVPIDVVLGTGNLPYREPPTGTAEAIAVATDTLLKKCHDSGLDGYPCIDPERYM